MNGRCGEAYPRVRGFACGWGVGACASWDGSEMEVLYHIQN